MGGIALNPGGAAILNRNQHTARIRAIVRTRGMDDLLHIFNCSIITANGGCNTKGIRAFSDALDLLE
jgi:hypothetical protein